MATRFYISNIPPTFVPGYNPGIWAANTGGVYALTPVKEFDNLIQDQTQFGPAFGSNVLLFRAVSERLAAQTISGDMNLLLGTRTSNASANIVWNTHVYVTQGDTNLVRGYLIFSVPDPGSSNLWTNIKIARELLIPRTINPLTIFDGDRLVCEIGFRVNGNLPSGDNAQTWIGTHRPLTHFVAPIPAPDLTLSGGADSNPDVRAGWIEFTANIAILPVPSRIDHGIIQSARLTPDVSAEVVHSTIQVAQGNFTASQPAEITHAVVQVVIPPPPPLPDLTGLYFLNPNKARLHDSYYSDIELKIPDPTIRTALLGE